MSAIQKVRIAMRDLFEASGELPATYIVDAETWNELRQELAVRALAAPSRWCVTDRSFGNIEIDGVRVVQGTR